jgi:hypothetical protein
MLKTNFDPNEFVASSQIDLTVVGHVIVSTVRLPKMMRDPDRWETCLFDDTNDSRSEVVAMYTSELEAQVNHSRIVDSLKFFNEGLKWTKVKTTTITIS